MRGRLLGASVGLIGGFVIGVAVTFFIDPAMTWPNRLVAGAVVGAIGLLLGGLKGI
jgi:hypothetical protein